MRDDRGRGPSSRPYRRGLPAGCLSKPTIARSPPPEAARWRAQVLRLCSYGQPSAPVRIQQAPRPSSWFAVSSTAPRIDFFHHREHRFGLFQPWHGLAFQADVFEKFGHLDFPRLVTAWIFVDRGFRRSHLRKHFVIGEALQPVTAAQAFHVELSMSPIDYEREEVHPFRATGVEPGSVPLGISQAEEGVVFDRHVPEVSRDVAFDRRELAEENPGEID